MSLQHLFQSQVRDALGIAKGGPGSGNFGHAGRPGERVGTDSDGAATIKAFEYHALDPSLVSVADQVGRLEIERKRLLDVPAFAPYAPARRVEAKKIQDQMDDIVNKV